VATEQKTILPQTDQCSEILKLALKIFALTGHLVPRERPLNKPDIGDDWREPLALKIPDNNGKF
jgi:hypothetical protein